MLPSSNLVTVVNYVANTRLHKLRLSPDPQGFPPSPSPPFSVDLGESDVRLASPRPTVCQTRSSPVPSRQKRRKVSCEKVPLKVEQGSPPNDAARLASNDSKWAHFTNIPFSAESISAQVLDTKSPADLSGLPANLYEKNVSFHETLSASCPDVDGDNDVAPACDATLPRDDDDDLFGDDDDDLSGDDLFGELPSFLPDDKPRSNFSDVSPRDTGSPRTTKRSRDDFDASLREFLLSFFFSRSTDNATPKTLEFDEDTRDSEALVVAGDTHNPETPIVLATPVVNNDYLHVDKKGGLNRDKKTVSR